MSAWPLAAVSALSVAWLLWLARGVFSGGLGVALVWSLVALAALVLNLVMWLGYCLACLWIG